MILSITDQHRTNVRYLKLPENKSDALATFLRVVQDMLPQISALDELRRREISVDENLAEEAEFLDFCQTQAAFSKKKAKASRRSQREELRSKREAEYGTRRGPVRKWYQDELCRGLSLDLIAEVDAFVDTNCPSLNEALIQDYSAQETQIELKQGKLDAVVPLSKAEQAELRRKARVYRDAMNKAYAIAGRLGEIGRVERFVLELRAREE